jgi:hypothetical protein
LLANGEIADPAEVDAMVASLQTLMPWTSPEEARLHLSQNRWSLQETIMVATVQSRLPSCTPEKARLLLSQHRWNLKDTVKSLFPDEATKHHVQADSLPRTLDAECECEKPTLATDTQTSPTTAQQVLGGLGAQTTTVVDRVYDPSPIPPDQPGNLAKQTTTTDTTPGQWTRGVEVVKTEKTGEFLASGRALRLLSQTPNSTVAPLSSSEAATACGAGPPEGAETPLSALGPQFQDKRPHLPEALLRTEQSCFLQDLPRVACHFCDYCPSKTLPEINDMFTFNDVGYILFDQTKWATYPDYHLKDHLQYPCTAKAVASIAHCSAFWNNCSIVVEEHDSHHISLPPINPLAIVQAPAEDEDVLTRSPEEHDRHHISLPPINPLAIVQAPAEDEDKPLFIVQAPAEDEDVLTRSPLRVSWTKDGWMDTLEEEKVWDEDEYYAHLDNLDFG